MKTRIRSGMAAFVHATVSWLENPKPGLAERLDWARQEVAALLDEKAGGQRLRT